jgi:membrane protein involved in colicin uptake
MADITVTTDFSQVNNLKEALQSTGTAYVRIVDGIVRENNRLKSLLKKAAKDTEETNKIKEQADAIYTAKLQQEADKREKLRAREAAKAEKEAQRVEAANQKVIASEVKLRAELEKRAAKSAQSFQAQVGPNLGLGAQGISASASASAMEGEIERLRTKYDGIYASSQLYEKSLNEINQAHMLGAISVKKHEVAVESLNVEYQNFQNGVALAGNRFATHVNQTSTGMNKFGMAAQQTGYQVSDFLVQIQGGTNPLVAFSQQATQLTGLLYIMSPALLASRLSFIAFSISMSTAIAGVTILVPLLAMLAMAFASSGKESDKTATSVDKQTQAYDALIAKVEQLRLARQMEATGISSKEEQVVQNNLSELLAKRAVLQERLNSLQNLGGRGAGFAGQVNEQKALLQLDIDKNNEAIRAIAYEQQLETAARRRANEERNAYREAKAEADRWKAALEGIKSALDSINGMAVSVTMDLKSTASGWAANFMEQLTSGLEQRAEYSAAVGAGRGLNMGGPELDPYGFRTQLERDATTKGSSGSSGGGGGSPKDIIADFQRQLELERELLGTSEAYQKVRQALGDDFKTTNPEVIAGLVQQATEIERLIELEQQRKSIMDTVKSSLEDGFMSMVDGTKSVKDAFKSMAAEIIKELYRVYVVQQIVGAVSGGLGSFFGGGAVTSSPRPMARPVGLAVGGSIMTGKSYLVGENGPEMVIPRHSGTVVNANQTANAGGGSGGFTQNLSINVTGSDSVMVRAEVAKMIPQITNATKAAVIDARLRGGQMKSAFR